MLSVTKHLSLDPRPAYGGRVKIFGDTTPEDVIRISDVKFYICTPKFSILNFLLLIYSSSG